MFDAARRLVEHVAFQAAVVGVIVLNAIVLGLETYPGVAASAGVALDWIDHVIVGFFVVELLVRFAAVGFRPLAFFRRGWNIFDTLIVVAVFLPWLPTNATMLRLLRLARVTRLLAVLPDVRIILEGIRRSAKPVSGLAFVTLFLVYLYGMLGHTLFGELNPEQWGTIGKSMMTLFMVLTLEGWPDLFAAVADSDWATVYFISFILIGAFVIMNMVIGIVLSTWEEAREANRQRREEKAEQAQLAEEARELEMMDRLNQLSDSIAALNARLDRESRT